MSRRGSIHPTFSLFSFQDIITSVTGIMILITLILAVELILRKESALTVAAENSIDEMRITVEDIEELQQRVERNRQLIEQLQRQQQQQPDLSLLAVNSTELKQRVAELQRVRERQRQRVTALQTELDALLRQLQRLQQQKRQADQQEQELVQIQSDLQKMQEQLAELRRSNRVIFNPAPGPSKLAWLVEVSEDELLVGVPGEEQVAQPLPSVAAFEQWLRQRNREKEYVVLLIKPSGIHRFERLQAILRQQQFEVGYDLLLKDQTALKRPENSP